MNDEREIRITDIIYVVIRRWKIIVVLALVGMGLGFLMSGISFVQTGNMSCYVWCTVAVTSQNEDGTYSEGYAHPGKNDVEMATDLTDAIMYMITSYNVRKSAIDGAGLASTVDPSTLYSYISTTRFEETQLIGVELQWYDEQEAFALLDGIINATKKNVRAGLMGSINVVDGPSVQYTSAKGRVTTARDILILVFLGALVGFGIAVLEPILHPTLLNLEDVDRLFGLETLGVIPKDEEYFRRKTNILARSDTEPGPVEQAFSSTTYILKNMIGSKSKRNCFYVTSADNNEGKSTVTANLAVQLSNMGHKVLLVDLDTVKPSLGGIFLDSVDYSRSLNALYKGEATVQEAINPLTGTLDFLPLVLERNTIPMDDTLFEMLEGISANYQFVIIDVPSIGKSADALALNRIANMALFVIGFDMVPVQEIQTSIKTVEKSGIRILGCVVNHYQTIDLGGLFGFGGEKKEEGAKRKKKRSETSEKERNNELNEMLVREDLFGTEEPLPEGLPKSEEGDLLSEVLDSRSLSDTPISTDDALDALLRMGSDGSWKNADGTPAWDNDATMPGAKQLTDGALEGNQSASETADMQDGSAPEEESEAADASGSAEEAAGAEDKESPAENAKKKKKFHLFGFGKKKDQS